MSDGGTQVIRQMQYGTIGTDAIIGVPTAQGHYLRAPCIDSAIYRQAADGSKDTYKGTYILAESATRTIIDDKSKVRLSRKLIIEEKGFCFTPLRGISINSQATMISSMYACRGGDEVTKFLVDNKFLIPLAYEAYDRLQTYFPSSTIFAEVGCDRLLISVGTNLSPEEADDRLHRFDEEWWIDASITSMGQLCIMVEFQ